jgi:hypothetical protein
LVLIRTKAFFSNRTALSHAIGYVVAFVDGAKDIWEDVATKL